MFYRTGLVGDARFVMDSINVWGHTYLIDHEDHPFGDVNGGG